MSHSPFIRPTLFVAFTFAVIACSSSGSPSDGASSPIDGGTTSQDGSVATGGDATTIDSSTMTGRDAASGEIRVDDTGKAALGTGEGITGDYGTFGVLTYSSALRVTPNPAGRNAFLNARKDTGEWTLVIPDTPGTYDCGKGATAGMASISVSDATTGVVLGTSAPAFGGACVMRVDSVTPTIEGVFAGILSGKGGATAPLKSGAFRFKKSL